MLTLIGLPLSIIYAMLKWDTLNEGEGWGVVAMVAVWAIFAIAFILDLVLQFFIREKKVLNFFEAILVVIFFISNYF